MSLILLEYLCPVCDARLESLEDRAAPRTSIKHCGRPAPRVISAPRVRIPLASVDRAKNDRPPKDSLGTHLLADGMPHSEWKARRRKARSDQRRAQVKANVG